MAQHVRLKEPHLVRSYSQKHGAYNVMIPSFVISNEKLQIFMNLVRILEVLNIEIRDFSQQI